MFSKQINYHYECPFVYRSLIKLNLTSGAMSLEKQLLFVDARSVIHPFEGKAIIAMYFQLLFIQGVIACNYHLVSIGN